MDSPAAQAANDAEASVKKIPLPTIETYEPKELSAAAAAYAVAARKLHDAEKEIAKIKADRITRDKRISQLTALLASIPSDPVDVWCCNYVTSFSIGATVQTIEVPGHFIDNPILRTAVLYPGKSYETTVSYYERHFNIAPNGVDAAPHGQLQYGEAMTSAAVFYNCAMEPGHERWKPIWRYGVLQSGYEDHRKTDKCTVLLNLINARQLSDDPEMPLDAENELLMTDVPIVYPPCNGRAFHQYDEVLVVFYSNDRMAPSVVGFRREPRKCPPTWREISPPPLNG